MQIIDFADIKKVNIRASTICLGSFDGFHCGHQSLIVNASLNTQNEVGVVLFTEHPSKFLGKPVKELMSLDEKIAFLKRLRVDFVIVIQTNKEFYSLEPLEFIDNYLKIINPKNIVVGEDFRFGYKGKGTPDLLKQYFSVDVVPLLTIDGEKVSSTLIRDSLNCGNIKKVNNLLQYNYQISGKVVKGLQNGKILGFCTGNLNLEDGKAYPKNGVYATLTYVNGIPYKSVTNIGIHPTIDKLNKPVLETHLFDFSQDLYNKTIYVEFIDFIRDEKKFANLDELVKQINEDKKLALSILNY